MNSATALTAAHMERAAYVYVRQSSEFQVRNNVERQRLQYALADHARELGFRDITVIDDDLGISGDGVYRPGFEALLEAVCKGKVGLVLSIEASRLSRNGREWHTLLDFCAIVGCLVGDRDRLYDPALIDDRVYLGLKGQFNEMELALFRQRSQESRIALAERGELRMHLPAGLRVGGRRSPRDDSGPATARRDPPGVPEIPRARQHPAGLPVVPDRESGASGPHARPGASVEGAGLIRVHQADSHQPAPCGRLRLWPATAGNRDRERSQARTGGDHGSTIPGTGRSCFAIIMKATSRGSSIAGTRS